MIPDTQLRPLTIPQTWNLEPETWNHKLQTHIAALKLSNRSQRLAIQHINVFAAWHTALFGSFEPETLTNYAILQYRHHTLEEARLTAATWNSRHWALSILCNWLGKPELMHGIAQKDGIPSEIHRALTDAEYHRLNQALETRIRRAITTYEHRDRTRDRAAVTLMLETGLRVDEISQLDRTDIQLSERTGWVRVRHGKGAKERRVPLNLLARNAIKDWLELRHDDKPALFDGKQTDRLSPRSIQRIATDLRAETNIPDLMCHSLRFTFAKRSEARLSTQGRGRSDTIRIIQRLLGHKRADTTEIYLRASTDDLLSAIEGMQSTEKSN